MKKFFLKCTVILLGVFLISACSDDEISTSSFTLNISGLEDLGSGYVYEGWLIVNGNPITTGIFSVDENGALSTSNFKVNDADLDNASTFVLTIEPSPDPDPGPSDVHILAGDFAVNSANLTVAHPAALNNTFESSTGKYILATPTNGSMNNENSGIWWIDLSSGTPSPGLDLPVLPAGWRYEGWTVIGGIPVSTGTFLMSSGVDDAAPFSGEMDGPPFPGEDFLTNAPFDLSFPTNIAGATAVISIEPFPDNSPNPFLLKPLIGQIPSDAIDHSVYDMETNLVFPTGTITR